MSKPLHPHMRPQSDCNATDGRTDVRTKTHLPHRTNLTLVDARRSEDRMATIGEVIEGGILRTPTRHEVVRIGERAPIPFWVRSAVWYRDGGRCELCADRSQATPWELDHIVPWSAGGSDDTTNLRVLCAAHNQQRSNFVDPNERPRRPATWWCSRCYMLDEHGWDYERGSVPLCPIHAPNSVRVRGESTRPPKRCPVMRAYHYALTELNEEPTWHQRMGIQEGDLYMVAYCAHCRAPGLTDRPL